MKKLFAIAAFLLASTAAQAQYTFEYGGHTIRIDPDRGTVSIPGVYDNSGRRSKRSHGDQDNARKQAPQQAKVDPQAPAADPAPTEQPPPRPPMLRPMPSTATATVAPADNAAPTQPAASAPAPQVQQDAAAPVAPAGPAAARGRRDDGAGAKAPCTRGSAGQFAARRVADRREGRQGPHRAMRRQSLRIFGGREIEPERRTGSDQHEARQGFQMERANPRSEHRQHL